MNVAASLKLGFGGVSRKTVSGGVTSAVPPKMCTSGSASVIAGAVDRPHLEAEQAVLDERTCHGLWQPSQASSGSGGAVGSGGSGGSLTSVSIRRHSNSRCSGGVRLSVPVNVNTEVFSVSWIGPVRYWVSGGSSSSGGNGPSDSYAPLSQSVFCGRVTPR